MMSECRTTKERISHSLVSGNLKASANGIGDAEMLTALGMAAIKANPAASAALRLGLAQDAAAYKDLRRGTMVEAGRMNLRQRWALVSDQLRLVVDAALRHFIVPICDKCLGLKYESIPGTPMLSDRPCRVCKGSGERPVLAKYRQQIGGVLNWLGQIEDELAAGVRRRTQPAFA